MCTLCQGNPQCVKYCPYEALSFLEITPDMPLRGMSPEKINQLLTEAYYQ
jgi:Fe-S-cluster-containing hydrogenase component 2